jgi:glutamine synthetase
MEEKLPLPPEFKGNAYESKVQRFPHALRDAIDCLDRGTMARDALGADVVDHYLTYARTEQALFDKVVTTYERERLFERG